MIEHAPLVVEPLRIATAGLSEGVRLTLAEEAHGLPRLAVLLIERSGLALTLRVEGVGDLGWIDALLPAGEAGEVSRPGALEVDSAEWGKVTIQLNGNKTASTTANANEPKRFHARLGVKEVRQLGREDQAPPRWACAVLAGAPYTDGVHQMWPNAGDYSVVVRRELKHGEHGFTDESKAANGPCDHDLLDLREHYAGEVRLGTFEGANTTIPRPGFLTFSGPTVPGPDDNLIHGIVRAVSLLFGFASCLVAWVARNEDGRVCAWVMRSGYSPSVDANAWPLSAFLDPARPWMIGAEPLSKALSAYLSKRDELALDRVAWLASLGREGPIDRLGSALRSALETLVEAGAKEIPRSVIEKEEARPLLEQLADVVAQWSSETGIDERTAQRLKSKVRQINDTSSIARLPEFLTAHNVSFGPIEKDAWDFSNACAHAAPAATNGGERMLFRFRALQATFGRIVVGVLGLHEEYIDYSTTGYPTRPVAQPVGGDRGTDANVHRSRQREPS